MIYVKTVERVIYLMLEYNTLINNAVLDKALPVTLLPCLLKLVFSSFNFSLT